MTKLSIDWARAEERPDKKLSVEGKVLLDLRSKINSLEKQLTQNKKDLERTSLELKTSKERLSEYERKAEGFDEKLASLTKDYERAKEEKLYADAEINKMKSSKSDIETKLSESKSTITEVEAKLKESSTIIEMLKREIEEGKENLQQKINEIEGFKSDLQKASSDKYVETETLREEKEAGDKEIIALKQKIMSLEDTIGEAKGAPQLIESIKDIMITKGFLSDREFDALLENKEI